MNLTERVSSLRAEADALDAANPRHPNRPNEFTLQNAIAAALREIANCMTKRTSANDKAAA